MGPIWRCQRLKPTVSVLHPKSHPCHVLKDEAPVEKLALSVQPEPTTLPMGPGCPYIYMEWHGAHPYKWPKIYGFHWGETNLQIF